MNKKLVAYFSASGVTQEVAELLAKAAGAECDRLPMHRVKRLKNLDREMMLNGLL